MGIVVGAVVVLVAAWITVGTLTSRRGAMPSFRFLDGQAVFLHLEQSKKEHDMNRVVRDVYSFAIDSSGLGMEANEELLDLGFVERPLPWPQWNGRCYSRTEPSGEIVTVRIIEQHKAFAHPLAASVAYSPEDGWISVEVMSEWHSVWYDVLRGPAKLLYHWGILK